MDDERDTSEREVREREVYREVDRTGSSTGWIIGLIIILLIILFLVFGLPGGNSNVGDDTDIDIPEEFDVDIETPSVPLQGEEGTN